MKELLLIAFMAVFSRNIFCVKVDKVQMLFSENNSSQASMSAFETRSKSLFAETLSGSYSGGGGSYSGGSYPGLDYSKGYGGNSGSYGAGSYGGGKAGAYGAGSGVKNTPPTPRPAPPATPAPTPEPTRKYKPIPFRTDNPSTTYSYDENGSDEEGTTACSSTEPSTEVPTEETTEQEEITPATEEITEPTEEPTVEPETEPTTCTKEPSTEPSTEAETEPPTTEEPSTEEPSTSAIPFFCVDPSKVEQVNAESVSRLLRRDCGVFAPFSNLEGYGLLYEMLSGNSYSVDYQLSHFCLRATFSQDALFLHGFEGNYTKAADCVDTESGKCGKCSPNHYRSDQNAKYLIYIQAYDAVWTDDECNVLVIFCLSNGEKAWVLFSIEKNVDAKTKEKVIQKVEELGLSTDDEFALNYAGCHNM